MSKIDKVGHRASGKNSAKCSFGCVICSLETAVKKILPNSEGFSLKVWKGQKNFLSLKLCFPRKIIFVFLECEIGKQAKNITPTVQKLLLQVRRKWKKRDFNWKRLFTRRTSGMIECSFDKRPLFFQKVWKWQNESSNFRRKFRKMFLWTANMPLRERSQKLWPLSELFSLEVWKTKKKFFKDIVLLKMLLRAQPTEIWPHC